MAKIKKKKTGKKTFKRKKKEALKVRFPLQAPRGTKDILPKDAPYWDFIYQVAKEVLESYNFQFIETPIFEDANLFVRGVGRETDIIEKEIYTFYDKSGCLLALRPEGTASVMRAYLENGMESWPKPVRLYYFGPMFRYDRPQAGRFREFHQIGAEIIGEADPIIDVQSIQILEKIFAGLGLKNLSLQMNSIGCNVCRPRYEKLLKDYYQLNRSKLCKQCRQRLKKNVLRLLDCKEEKCQQLANNAPQTVDHLCEDCGNHFKEVLGLLDDFQISYNLNSRLVRGLNYYSRTVFEIWPTYLEEGAQSALGGGGRYDYLLKELGGKPTPAIGFSAGCERIIAKMQSDNVPLPMRPQPQVFLIQLGNLAKKKSLQFFEKLRVAGIPVAESFGRDSIKAQLKRADRMQVKWSLIIGQKEALDGTVILRNMESGMQEIIDQDKIIPILLKRLKNHL